MSLGPVKNGDPLISDQHFCSVAVDVGNTAVKLAVHREDSVANRSIPIHTQSWPVEAIDWVSGQLGCQNIRWLISSVHRSAAENLIAAIQDRPSQDSPGQHRSGQADVVKVIRHQDIPMQVRVDDPAALGIDRLLSAFAAVKMIGAAAVNSAGSGSTTESNIDRASSVDVASSTVPMPNTVLGPAGLVVIDAGSAITVDWIDREGTFRGGAILPGLRLQAKSLAIGTDALPEIDWNGDWQACLPATNTRDAIFGGILLGAAGAIDALTHRYLKQDSEKTDPVGDGNSTLCGVGHPNVVQSNVVLTGGDATAISAHLDCPHQCLPHLVCHGLLELGTDSPG